MGFLRWWQNNKKESYSQLSWLEDSARPIYSRERVDGATVYRDFTQAIKDAGAAIKSITLGEYCRKISPGITGWREDIQMRSPLRG